jgi:hypothetical protein
VFGVTVFYYNYVLFFRFISFFTSKEETTDNTCVTVWPQGDRVFVATETHKIHEINPETLETLQTVTRIF